MNKLQSLAAVGIMSLSLAAPVVFGQGTTAQQGGTTTNSSKEGKGGHGRRGGKFGHRGMGGIFHALDLTDAQKAQAKQIRESHQASIQALRGEIRAKHKEIRQSQQGGTFNEALATQKLTEIAGTQAKLMGEEFQIRQQMLSLLTPEQKTKLDQLRTEWKAKRAERRAPQV
ncbi:MAG: periplasmic protein CpxP/Spy [Blastocatellia bacterium]|jgi:protein CpxP|nr:periplasmic protein CpxP/Spy [Blastocatellia bacterium]